MSPKAIHKMFPGGKRRRNSVSNCESSSSVSTSNSSDYSYNHNHTHTTHHFEEHTPRSRPRRSSMSGVAGGGGGKTVEAVVVPHGKSGKKPRRRRASATGAETSSTSAANHNKYGYGEDIKTHTPHKTTLLSQISKAGTKVRRRRASATGAETSSTATAHKEYGHGGDELKEAHKPYHHSLLSQISKAGKKVRIRRASATGAETSTSSKPAVSNNNNNDYGYEDCTPPTPFCLPSSPGKYGGYHDSRETSGTTTTARRRGSTTNTVERQDPYGYEDCAPTPRYVPPITKVDEDEDEEGFGYEECAPTPRYVPPITKVYEGKESFGYEECTPPTPQSMVIPSRRASAGAVVSSRRSSMKGAAGSNNSNYCRRHSTSCSIQEVTLPNTKEKVFRRTTISFDSEVDVRTVPSMKDILYEQGKYDADERLWFQPSEIAKWEEKANKIIDSVENQHKIRKLHAPLLGIARKKPCTRGLESYMKEYTKHRMWQRNMAWEAVLQEQSFQQNDGYYDDRAMRDIYLACSQPSLSEARLRAKQDECEVQKYLKSTRKKEVRRMSCV